MSEPKGSRCAMSHRYSTKISSLEEAARRICENRGGKWSGTKGMACCPAHDDRTPSLGVSLGQKAILFHCFAGCDQQSVLAALASEGVDATSLFSGSSAILGAELGLPVTHLDHHASYIASWLKILKSDERAILTAAAKAEEAASLLLELGGHQSREGEADIDLADAA
nr:zincin-like metallopeptidase domain-containing protein [Pacificimonas flava]